MAHNQRYAPDVFYVNGVPIPQEYFRAIDTAQSKAVNGDAGGTWGPITPIVVGGAGMWLACPTTVGPLASIITSAAHRILHAANDVPVLGPGHTFATRNIITQAGNGADTNPASFNPGTYGFGGTFGGGAISLSPRAGLCVPLRVHDGAIFVSATVNVVINGGHSTIPKVLPAMSIIAVDSFGSVAFLGTTPWVTMTAPASVGLYNGQRLQIVCTLNPLITVLRTTYVYYALIADESGVGSLAGNAYEQIICRFINIPDLRFQ